MTQKRITHPSLLAALLVGCISCTSQPFHPPQQELPPISTHASKDAFIQALEQGDVEQLKQLIAAQKVNKQAINTPMPLLPAPLPVAQADAPATSSVAKHLLACIKESKKFSEWFKTASMKYADSPAERPAHTAMTPLLFSAQKGHWEVVALLLDNGAAVQGEENEAAQEAFWLAADAEQWDLVKHCIQQGIYVKDEGGAMVLLMAVEKKQWEIAKLLIAKDIDVRWCGEILKMATYARQWKIVEQLVAKDIDTQGPYGRCALSTAAIARQWAIVAQLVDQGATLSQGEEDGWAFQAAVDHGQWEFVAEFINSSNISKYGRTALRAAAKKGQWEMIDKLLEAGLSLEEKDRYGETAGHDALRAAAQEGQWETFDKLLEKGLSLEQKDRWGEIAGSAALKAAAQNGHLAMIDKLLEKGVSLEQKDRWGATVGSAVLRDAAEKGHYEMIDKLLERGVSLKEDRYGETAGSAALRAAAEKGQWETFDKLLEKGVGLEEKNRFGETAGSAALRAAAEKGQWETFDKLLEQGVSLEQKDKEGVSAGRAALFKAVETGKGNIVSKLIAQGVNIETKGELERTPLIWAAFHGQVEIVRWLLAQGANIHARDRNKGNALVWAWKREHPAVICLLIEKGAYARGHAGYAALQWAAIGGKLATFRMLIDKGANVHRKDNLDRTLLMHAAEMGQEAIVECILALHLSLNNIAHMINEQDRYGRTALLWAAKNDQPTIAKLLLNHGADPTLKDRGDKDALYWSEHYGNQLVSAVLQDEGLTGQLGPGVEIRTAP